MVLSYVISLSQLAHQKRGIAMKLLHHHFVQVDEMPLTIRSQRHQNTQRRMRHFSSLEP